MRLTELQPRWMRWMGDGRSRHVDTFAEAQCVFLLCPKCFVANGGERGTHAIIVPFEGRGVPPEAWPGTARWAVSGSSFEDLTTTPSILLKGGCGRHGYLTNGEATIA